MASSVPFQWPRAWRDPDALNLLSGSPINCIPTLRVAGRYRAAKLRTLDQPAARYVESVTRKDALQVRLPPVKVYAGVERET